MTDRFSVQFVSLNPSKKVLLSTAVEKSGKESPDSSDHLSKGWIGTADTEPSWMQLFCIQRNKGSKTYPYYRETRQRLFRPVGV